MWILYLVPMLLVSIGGLSQKIPKTDNGSCKIDLQHRVGHSRIAPTVTKTNATLLMLFGFGGLSVMLAKLHNTIRKYVFQDSHNLDTAFDAGGRVTFSLTVVTVTSQMLWPSAYLLQPTFVVKFGLGGAVLPTAIIVTILLFPMLSLNLKTRAPGAKTYLQIVYTRFGKPAHIVFCVVALLANLITTTGLILAGKTTINGVTNNKSDEYVVFILAVLFGSYCLIGGIGTTFYISYFNTAITFITLFVVIVQLHYSEMDKNSFLTMESMYDAFNCINSQDGNQENSFLTFRSRSCIIYACIIFLQATSLGFCDQANWQSRIAAKPVQGVLGFCLAAYMWYFIPTSLSLSTSLSYISLSYRNGSHLLSSDFIDKGYVFPLMISEIMGTAGGYLILTMLTMAWMSTGSGEVMAVSSILVYDIYKTYINPFRQLETTTSCPLCGMNKVQDISNRTEPSLASLCSCISADECEDCEQDLAQLQSDKMSFEVTYKCRVHGKFRQYEDLLIQYKNWCIVWVTIGIIPFGLVVLTSGIDLNWSTLFLNTLLCPFLVPLLLTLIWSKTTAVGVICGTIFGLLSDLCIILVIAATVYPSGLDNFLTNTTGDYSVMGGALSGLLVSTLVTVVVSTFTSNVRTSADEQLEWDKTMSIDNPLNPWRRLYKSELTTISSSVKITSRHLSKLFRKARWTAYVVGTISVILWVIVLPASLLSMGVLSYNQFYGFVVFLQVLCFLGAIFSVIAPPVEEAIQINKHYNMKRDLERRKSMIHENVDL